jgi:hypothetical protein
MVASAERIKAQCLTVFGKRAQGIRLRKRPAARKRKWVSISN